MRYVPFILLCLLTACSSEKKKDPLMDEAGKLHLEATAIQEQLEPQIGQIDTLVGQLKAKNMPAATATATTLDSLQKAFETWEENLVEVPGLPHKHAPGEHRHAGPHHHSDATLKDLPPAQLRDLQRETLASIRAIQQRTEAATQQAAALLN